MELAVLVWLISMLNALGALTVMLAIASLLAMAVFLIVISESYGEKVSYRNPALAFVLAIFLFLVSIAIPSEKTAYIMVGAYAAQKIATDPKVQQMSSKVLTIIEQKLDSYIVEADKNLTPAPTKQ